MKLFRHPVLCNYYVTYRCNASCSFCDIWEKPSPYITLENVEVNLRDLKRLGVKIIDFTGGEPLLHRQIGEMVGLAHQMGFITTLTTNALLYPKHAEKLNGKVDMLHFSLDSPIREEHDQSRGVACFDQMMLSIKLALSLGEQPDILFTVHEENIHQIEQVYREICQPNGLFLLLNPIFRYAGKGSNLSIEALRKLRQWGKQPKVHLNPAFLTLREKGGNHINEPVCKAMSTTVVISPENEMIMPCYHLGVESLPIQDNLYALRQSDTVKKYIGLEGRLQGCEGCSINCYMQPSFAAHLSRYFFEALPSTIKYALEKGIWKKGLFG